VNAFLGELAKKITERWPTLLLPGLLWVAVVAIAAELGHRKALDPRLLLAGIDALARNPNNTHPAVILATIAAILAGAAGSGLMATWLGRTVQHSWTTPGRRPPARWIAGWRRQRWNRAYAGITAAVAAAMPRADIATVTAGQPTAHAAGLAQAVHRCTRICPVPADRPSWIGDRLRAVDVRVHAMFQVDLSAAWPRLWLVLPDSARTELTTAYNSYTAAARLFGWATLYLAIAPWWWPALAISIATGTTAWTQARSAATVLADLTEAAVDLYGPDLARQLGIDCTGPLTPNVGHQVTSALRKDDTLHPVQQPEPRG
jgi:hypothetical protein